MGFLTRETFENAKSFQEAKDSLSNDDLIAPVYFILGGTKPGEVNIDVPFITIRVGYYIKMFYIIQGIVPGGTSVSSTNGY